MANGQVFTNNGRKISMHRIFDSAPVYTAPSAFKVGTGTTTPSVADTTLTTAITIGGAATKAFVSGYPTEDDTTYNIVIRGLLLVTECNSNTISEFGIVNADGTPQLFSHAVFTGVAKTASVQMIFREVDVIM